VVQNERHQIQREVTVWFRIGKTQPWTQISGGYPGYIVISGERAVRAQDFSAGEAQELRFESREGSF